MHLSLNCVCFVVGVFTGSCCSLHASLKSSWRQSEFWFFSFLCILWPLCESRYNIWQQLGIRAHLIFLIIKHLFGFVLFLFPNLSFTHLGSPTQVLFFLPPSSSLSTHNLTQSLEVQGRRRRRSGPVWEPPMELSPLVHTAPRGEVVLHGKLNKTRKTLSVYPSPVQGQTAVRWWKEEVSRGLCLKRMNEWPFRNFYKSKVQDFNLWCNQAVTSVWLPWPAYSSQNEFWQLSEWQVRTCFMSMDWAMWCEGKDRKKEVAGRGFCTSHGSTEVIYRR